LQRLLARLRRLCLGLPEAEETTSFGHPTFEVKNKTFAVLEEYQGELAIVFKATLADQTLLTMDPQFYVAPYTGKHGWTSMHAGGALDWGAVEELVRASYRLVAPKRLAATLDAVHSLQRTRRK
jgi:predicted DNA-binding protein (MmcQ/YjbR family)